MPEDEVARTVEDVRGFVEWLADEHELTPAAARKALGGIATASVDLPAAERLGRLLDEIARANAEPPRRSTGPEFDEVVEDFLVIERVAPGRIWFPDGVGRSRSRRRPARLPGPVGRSTWSSVAAAPRGTSSRSATSTRRRSPDSVTPGAGLATRLRVALMLGRSERSSNHILPRQENVERRRASNPRHSAWQAPACLRRAASVKGEQTARSQGVPKRPRSPVPGLAGAAACRIANGSLPLDPGASTPCRRPAARDWTQVAGRAGPARSAWATSRHARRSGARRRGREARPRLYSPPPHRSVSRPGTSWRPRRRLRMSQLSRTSRARGSAS